MFVKAIHYAQKSTQHVRKSFLKCSEVQVVDANKYV